MTKRATIAQTGLTDHERRILAYLDQHGATHRSKLAADLSDPSSNTARHQRGSNGAVPLIVGRWCARLVRERLVQVNRTAGSARKAGGWYDSHAITEEGQAVLRMSPADIVPIHHDLDECECGDYRRDHVNGTGRCRMPDDLNHGLQPCEAFRLSKRYQEGDA